MARCQRHYPDCTAWRPTTSTWADLAFIFLQAVLIYSDVTSQWFVFKVSSRGTIPPLSSKQEEEEEGREEPLSLPPSVSPELQTAEHLTSTGPSPLLRHRHSVTSTRLIFSPGYERLMEGEVWEGGKREGPGSASGSVLPVHFLLEAAGAALLMLGFFFLFFFFQTEVLEGKEASRQASRPGVSLSLPSPAENPPPIIWATAHTTVPAAATAAAATTARSPSSQQTATLNQIFEMRGGTKITVIT